VRLFLVVDDGFNFGPESREGHERARSLVPKKLWDYSQQMTVCQFADTGSRRISWHAIGDVTMRSQVYSSSSSKTYTRTDHLCVNNYSNKNKYVYRCVLNYNN